MAETVGLFTPVLYEGANSWKHQLYGFADGCFSFGNRAAFVLPGKGEEFVKIGAKRESLAFLAAKIVILATFLLPALLLIGEISFAATLLPPLAPLSLLAVKLFFRTTHTFPIVDDFVEEYYASADQYSFWDGYLGDYLKAVQDPAWRGRGAHFLKHELEEVAKSLRSLDAKMGHVEAHQLRENIQYLLGNVTTALETLVGQLAHSRPPSGIRNAGNTCYINAALQPLLAIQNLGDLIPSTPIRDGTETILQSWKEFYNAWKHNQQAHQLGECIATLRRAIFAAGLTEGGFLDPGDEWDFQDAGQFFELILHVLGRGFALEMRRTSIHEGEPFSTSREKTSEGVFYLKSPGATIQEKVNHKPPRGHFAPGNEWRVGDVLIAEYEEENKIVGPLPEILVIRVDFHTVDLQEQVVDFAPLFRDPAENCRYELVGFAQNRHQTHWTSVARRGDQWYFCDDSSTRAVSPTHADFRWPANYLVYKKTDLCII